MKILAAVIIGTITGFVVAFKQSLVLRKKASWCRIHSLAEPQDNIFLKDYIDTKIELEISRSVEKLISKVDDTAKNLIKKVDENSKTFTGEIKELSKNANENSKTFTGEIKELSKNVNENSKTFTEEIKELSKKVDNLDLEFQAWKKAFTIFAGVSSIIVAANIPTFLRDIFPTK